MDAFALLEREIVGMKSKPYEMSEEEDRKATMAQMKRLIELKRKMGAEAFEVVKHALLMYDRATSMRLYVHETLFCETIRTQGTKEQINEFLPKAESGEIFGCFGMTELCHSSFLRGLKTRAVFEPEDKDKNDEKLFISENGLNSPSNPSSSKFEAAENGKGGSYVLTSDGIGATKWWIGGSGQTASHAVVLAQLEGAGTVWFVVPLRNIVTGEPMPGVEIGHLGPKSGRAGLDSGWFRFNHVRVPASHLLSRFLTLNPNGTFVATPNTQHLAYNTLIGERLQALSEVASSAAQAAVIATRYTLVRRQGPNNPQVMDFKIQYTSLMPQLATSFVIPSLHATLFPLWSSLVASGETHEPAIVADWHATAASLKTLWSWWGLESIEISRRSLGGHAFSSFNAISGLWKDYGVLTTGGGDNYVLAQQCAQYLIKSYFAHISHHSSRQPSKASSKPSQSSDTSSLPNQSYSNQAVHHNKKTSLKSTSFLSNASRLKTFGLDWPLETLLCATAELPAKRQLLEQLLLAMRAAIIFLLDSLLLSFSKTQDWNEHMNELISLSNLHGMQLTVQIMLEKLEAADFKIQPIFADLVLLHTLHHCTSSIGSILLEHNVLTAIQFTQLKKQCYSLAKSIRKNAALIADAFAFPDYVIKAPLGRYDGDIYQPYFDMVKAVNHQKVTPYWDSHIKPLFAPSSSNAKL